MNQKADITANKQQLMQLTQSGDFAEAKQLCDHLCKQNPDDPEAWFLMGAIHGQLSEFGEAETCCKRALSSAPDHPILNFNLAIALLNQGKADEAIPRLEKTLSVQPGFADAYRELGNAQAATGQRSTAIISYRKAIELDPAPVLAYLNLGNTLRDLQRWDEAVECYEHAIRLKPDFIDAYIEISSVLITRFRYSRSIEILESAIRQIPDSAELFFKLAVSYFDQGDADIALRRYRKALELDSEHINARIGMSSVLGLQGKYAEAIEELDQIFELSPDHPTAMATYAQFAHKVGATDRAARMIETKLDKNDVSNKLRSALHFSLAKLYDRKDEFDTAFHHFDSGNKLASASFDYQSYVQMFDAITTAYAADAITQLTRSENTSDIPVFVIGMPRSGTSLVEQILSSHPSVFGAGELRNINYTVDKLPERLAASPYPLCLDKLTTPLLNQLADEYIDELLARSGGSKRVIDKAPLNFIHLGFIDLLFPNARIIHCVRDPVDTCLSCFFQNFTGEHAYAYSLIDIGRFYRLYQSLMTHWKRVIRLPVHEIKYEDLVLDQEGETRKLLDFCDLEWNQDCLDFHTSSRTVSTASHEQVRQPMYTKSMGRWKNFEKHLDPLFASLDLKH